VGRPVHRQRKPNRDLLDPVRLADQALAVSLELLDSGKQLPSTAQPLQVLLQAS
jgi:hypothetical protein